MKEYFPTIEHFDEDSLYRILLPVPIPEDMSEELYRKGILKKEELETGVWYYGTCRNSSKARWNGKLFTYPRTKFGSTFTEEIYHFADDNGFDVFIPLKKL